MNILKIPVKLKHTNKSVRLLAILLTSMLLSVISCQAKESPRDITIRFLNYIDKGKFDDAFKLWDFNYALKSKSYFRGSPNEEIQRWKNFSAEWKKNNVKPYIKKKPIKKTAEEYWLVIILTPRDNPDFPPKQVILALRNINNEWKIIGYVKQL